jgi:hypothetical protein
MTEKDRMHWLRAALLQIIDLHVTLGSLRSTLLDQGLIDLDKLRTNQAMYQDLWKAAKETVAKLGDTDGPTPEELLRKFEGPKN